MDYKLNKQYKLSNKTFEDPVIRWSKYWQLPEYFVRHIFKMIFLWGCRDIESRIFTKQIFNKDITRRSLQRFKLASRVYFNIQNTGLKKGAFVSNEFFKKPDNISIFWQ